MSFCNQLSLINPAIALIFASSFFAVWRPLRSRRLLAFGGAFTCYAVAAAIQVFSPPRDFVWTTLAAAPFYIGTALLIACGMLWRSGASAVKALVLCAVVGVLELGLLGYFHFVVPDFAARVYIHNFGAGLIFLIALAHLGRLRQGSATDRMLYWVFFAFSLNVAVRTLLNTTAEGGEDPCARTFSSYWINFQIGQTLFNVSFCLALLASEAHALIGSIKHERDTDALTKLHNRRSFATIARAAMPDAGAKPVALVLADIDLFKFINDNYGHASGDAILVGFAQIVKRVVGARGTPARLGGEEFAILLPGATRAEAIRVAEEIRAALELARFEILPCSQTVTASFGVATWRPYEPLDDLMSRADGQLYAAKRSGRNRVHAAVGLATVEGVLE